MAKKSKTQRAKASAARAARKAQTKNEATGTQKSEEQVSVETSAAQKPKRSLLKKTEESQVSAVSKQPKKTVEKKPEKPKKKRFQFLYDVRSEMKRVTWPTRQDVLRWSGVVVVALVFFGVFVLAFDTLFVRVLTLISGIGA